MRMYISKHNRLFNKNIIAFIMGIFLISVFMLYCGKAYALTYTKTVNFNLFQTWTKV